MMRKPETLIAGCGYVGFALARHLIRCGHTVIGLRRSQDAQQAVESAGARFLRADLTKPETLKNFPKADWVVACPSAGQEGDYQATYLEGAQHLVASLLSDPPKKLVWVSSTGVYGQTNGAWVDEQTPPEPSTERSRILLEAEKVVLGAVFPSVVVRLGGIYGPGRDFVESLQAGRAPIGLSSYINLIHRDDIVEALVCVMERGSAGEVYLAVDDAPVSRAAFYDWVAKEREITPAPFQPGKRRQWELTDKRCSNKKLRSLGWRPKFPTHQAGLAALWKSG